MSPSARPSALPVFVCGLGRSGTSWLSNALGQSDELVYVGEAWLLAKLREVASWNEQIWDEWGDFTTWRRMGYGPDRFRAALGAFHQGVLAEAAGGHRFVEKTPGSNLNYLDDLVRMLPDAHYVLIYRDGRNQVASLEAFRRRLDIWFDFTHACRDWARTMDVVRRYRDGEGAVAPFIIRYEEMVADFDGVFEDLCGYVGIAPFRPEAYRPNTAFPDTEGDFNRRWRDWDDERRETFRREAGRQLVEWGYAETAGSW